LALFFNSLRPLLIRWQGPVKRGDGVVFDAGKPMEREQGGSVMGVLSAGGAAEGTVQLHTPPLNGTE
jgi:hypothetical protein